VLVTELSISSGLADLDAIGVLHAAGSKSSLSLAAPA
jgi:hypothetical protein